ncbi:MAG: hypothetical protein KKI02_03670 [Planctomycetes bacterium]|nr:hypothetical protein [Planctomycetota bacterium]
MSQRLIATGVVIWAFAFLAATAVHGQRRTEARINRPSSSGPSARLGLVGGWNTGRYGDPYRLTNVAPGSLGAAGRGLSQPNFFGGGWRMARLPAPALPQAFLSRQPGSNAPTTVSPWAGALRGAQAREVAWASRLQASFQLSVPLVGIAPTRIRLPNSPYFVPEATGTAFHTFFGLKPTEPEPLSQVPIPDDGWVGLLERENDELLLRKKAEALEIFKAATRDGVEQRFERLSEAEAALRMVRDLDREAHIPCLLLLHVALERHQLLGAATHLADAVRRHPAVFVERPDLASYFGDPKLPEQTARAYLKVGDSDQTPEAYALQAYCAWVLNDRTRLKDALDQMTADDIPMQRGSAIVAIRNALAAAVR